MLDDQLEGVQSAAFLANSSRLLATVPYPSEDHQEICMIKVWDVDNGECINKIPVQPPSHYLVFWSICTSGLGYDC